MDDNRGGAHTVVFLHCEALELERLTYKPDFPDSVFHLTLYEGVNYRFADRILKRISMQRWGWDVRFPSKIGLDQIPVGVPKDSTLRWRTTAPYLRDAASLLRDQGVTIPFDPLEHKIETFSAVKKLGILDDLFASLVERSTTGKDNRASKSSWPTPLQAVQQRAVIHTLFDLDSFLASPDRERQALEESRRNGKSHDRDLDKADHYATLPELIHEVISIAIPLMSDRLKKSAWRVATLTPYSRQTLLTIAHLLSQKAQGKLESIAAHESDLPHLETLNTLTQVHSFHALRSSIANTSFQNIVESDLVVSNLVDTLVGPTAARISRKEARRAATSLEYVRYPDSYRHAKHAMQRTTLRYVHAVLSTIPWLRPEAIGVWILPSRFLRDKAARSLRRYLSSQIELLYLHNYEKSVPSTRKLKASYTVVIARNRRPTAEHKVTWSDGPHLLSSGDGKRPDIGRLRVPVRQLQKADRWEYLYVMRRDRDELLVEDLFEVLPISIWRWRAASVVDRQVAKQLLEMRIETHALFPSIRVLLNHGIDLAHVDDRALECVNEHYAVYDLEIEEALARLSANTEELSRLQELLRSSRSSSRWSHITGETIGERLGVHKQRYPRLEFERQPIPILFANVRSRGEGLKRPARFVRNLTDRTVLSSYIGLQPKPHIADAILMERLDLEMLFGELQLLESQLLARHVRFHQSASRPFGIQAIGSLPVPRWAVPVELE